MFSRASIILSTIGGWCLENTSLDTPPPPTEHTPYGQPAVGTHPAGMHSCFSDFDVPYKRTEQSALM